MTVNTRTPRIVVLDDDPFMLKLLARMLERLGYTQVTTCDSGEEALRQINRPDAAVDVIFLDINMPGMDGIEFIRRLVEYRYGGWVVPVSGEGDRILESVHRLIGAQRLKALAALQKPVDPESLAAVFRELKLDSRSDAPKRATRQAYDAEQLRAAIINGELVNYYQPQVALATGAVVGVESLVRWQHPRDGLVFPDQFITLAEESGLIGAVTHTVMAAAMKQAKEWRQAGHHLSVAINVSTEDMMRLDFPDVAATLARSAGIDPAAITLEITEGRVMRQLSTVLDVLSRLRLKHFVLSIDDFGTGHSSLAQLRDLPFDELKVDRSFVHGAADDEKRLALCKASLQIAQQLELHTVAEGIEDERDWAVLRKMGCDVGQGYFIAKPMPAAELTVWLQDWSARWCDSIRHVV